MNLQSEPLHHKEEIVLVNESDEINGFENKWTVHQKGLLHRAFSIFIFNSEGELLIQQRAINKYHSGGLWSNTCCSHPAKGEQMQDAVNRRLREEMQMECKTKYIFKFKYQFHFANGLTEYEIDHVYFGKSDTLPQPDATEVMNWKYISLEALSQSIKEFPESYSEWLKICLPEVKKQVEKTLNF